jgi:hypothetical protein
MSTPKAKRSKARTHQGLTYRSLQQKNSTNRVKLSLDQQKWLKQNGYRNVGWEACIQLDAKIVNLLEQNELEDFSLEELFLEADRIGGKYQTNAEVEQFQQNMAKEANAIGDLIEQQFPQTELEVIDFSQPSSNSHHASRRHNRSIKSGSRSTVQTRR